VTNNANTVATNPSDGSGSPGPGPLPTFGPNEKWVLYDGPCVLCNATVSWLQRRDRRAVLNFTPHPNPDADGVAFWDGNRWHHAHQALSPILKELPTPYPFLGSILARVPEWGTKKMYRWIAAHRYTLFGKNEKLTACPVPHSSTEPPQRSC